MERICFVSCYKEKIIFGGQYGFRREEPDSNIGPQPGGVCDAERGY